MGVAIDDVRATVEGLARRASQVELALRVIEDVWIFGHEDVQQVNAANLLGPAPAYEVSTANHGLSGASLVVADRNAFGITGAADEAAARLIAIGTTGGIEGSLALAVSSSQPGDVVMIVIMVLVPGLGPGTFVPLEFYQAAFDAVLTATAMNSSTNILSRLGDLAVLWYGATLVIKGDLTLGQLIAFRIIAGNVTTPLMRLSQSWQNFQEVALSVQRLGDVLNSPAEQTLEQGTNIPMPQIKGKVEFDAITFAYVPGQQPQLRNVSFEIPAGSFVGVVGKSGSGKSTVLKLLPRLYTADSGRILVDDYEVAKVELYSLRRQIGTVLQDSLLFNSSVFSNIAVSDPDATPEDVMRAARVAGAHDFIMGLPEGYNTCVGEQGRALSGGQRQRVAIARTVLQRPRLLILDEATSSIDTTTESLVQEALERLFKGRTSIIIAHRLATVRSADRILVVQQGLIVEDGSHSELIAQNGIYAKLYAHQLIDSA
jgi:ATP-binding cassette subfamily B protein